MNEHTIESGAKALERIALVLAALYGDRLGEMGQGQKAERLSGLGSSNAQIADALGTSENSINVSRVTHRKKSKRAAKSKANKSASRGKAKRK